jgi:hypothetical protein
MLCEQQEEDEIQKISDYFDKIMFLRKKEYYNFPIKMDKNFFIDYCKMYSDKSCENIRIIKKMYDKYMEIYRKKENIGIDDYYHKTGINLISDGKLYNANLLIFLNNDPYFKEGKDISLDLICKGIKFNNKDKFVNDFFNNQIDEIDIKKLFGRNYDIFMTSLISIFRKPKDLISINNLVFEEPVHEDIIAVFLNIIEEIWLHNPNSDMFDAKKLIGDVFRLASKKFNSFETKIGKLEKKISKSKLLPIYSEILYRHKDYSSNFKKHIIKYINENKEDNALSIWNRLTTLSNEEEKIDFLKEQLNAKYAVQVEDFISYPEEKAERIIYLHH